MVRNFLVRSPHFTPGPLADNFACKPIAPMKLQSSPIRHLMKTPIEIRPSPCPPGPTQISVQNFTAVRCAVVEFIACTRYDTSRLFSRYLEAAFPLRKFYKESLMHGPLNLCVNEKTESRWLPVLSVLESHCTPSIPIKIIMPHWVIRRAYHLLRCASCTGCCGAHRVTVWVRYVSSVSIIALSIKQLS